MRFYSLLLRYIGVCVYSNALIANGRLDWSIKWWCPGSFDVWTF